MRVLATYNIKGGVGKTAAAVNLAYEAAGDGGRVLLWDLDPQGSATFCFRIKTKVKGGSKRLLRGGKRLEEAIKATDFDGLDLVPADFSYRHLDRLLDKTKKPERELARLLAPLAEDYDLVFLDCAPSASLLSESVFRAADGLIIPLLPAALSLHTFARVEAFCRAKGRRRMIMLPFLSMVDRRKRLHREIVESCGRDGERFLRSVIPSAAVVERTAVERAPVGAIARGSAAARAYRDLWQEIKHRLPPEG